MLSRRNFALAAIVLTSVGITLAAEPPSLVVLVQYIVNGNSAQRVEEMLTSPIERSLITLERVADIQSVTAHRSGHIAVDVEIQFEGGATEQDLAVVMKRIAQLEFSGDVQATSVSVHLRAPRLH